MVFPARPPQADALSWPEPKQKAKIRKLGLNSLSLGLLFWAQAKINAFGAGNTGANLLSRELIRVYPCESVVKSSALLRVLRDLRGLSLAFLALNVTIHLLFQHLQRHGAIFQNNIVKFFDVEPITHFLFRLFAQFQNL